MVTSVFALQVNPFYHPSNCNTERSSRVIQQVLFSVTVFACPSLPEWVTKSGDSSSFLRPLQRIPSSSQLWQRFVFCLYRFSVFSSCIFLPSPLFKPHAFSRCFIALLFTRHPSCFLGSPFMRAICRKWFHDLNMIFWGFTHKGCVFMWCTCFL